jgi:dTDP-4-dehydrorhamnose 3,5-epimerase
VKFTPTEIPGAFLVDIEPIEDQRGFFARTWCREEFSQRGLNPHLAQSSVSFNWSQGTLRGMHYQVTPHQEAKLVRCTMGTIYDVIVDLRPDSPTLRRWMGIDLSAVNRRMLFIPEGLAHGFITLQDDTEVLYQMSCAYHAASARGVRWDDPAFGIRWPTAPKLISERDRTYPDFMQ